MGNISKSLMEQKTINNWGSLRALNLITTIDLSLEKGSRSYLF